MGLKVGEEVPEFSLKDQQGNWFHLQEHLGKGFLVVFFYPKDYTPGCTKEVCAFRDHYEDFTDLGAEVVGISSDSEKMHHRFSNSYRLPFRLLSDPKQIVRKIFRVESTFLNLLPGRETYVIDEDGKIISVFNDMNAAKHMYKALEAIKNANK